MPYPFSWRPNAIFVTTPSQVTVFDSNNKVAMLDVGVAVSIDSIITFSVTNPGTYLVKVRYNLEVETAKFTTISPGTATPQYVSYERITQEGLDTLSNFLTLDDFYDPDSVVRAIVEQTFGESPVSVPTGGTNGQVLRKTADAAGNYWSTITKSDVGLSDVDNTSDTNKPISTAQQNALSAKAPIANPTFTGTVAGVTKTHVGLGNVDNTSDADKPISTAQATGLAPKANPTFTGTVAGVTKTHVGLGNVDNTTDAGKPVSTAQATAINAKRGLVQAITTRTATPYSVVLADEIIFANMATAITITLPDPATANITGREYTIKNIGAGTLTLNSAGTSKTIDGAATQTLAQWARMKVVSNGTNWFIVA